MTKRLLGVLSLVLAAVLVISLAPRTPVNAQSSGGHRITSSSDVVGLFTSCSGTQYLGADGACHNSGSSLPTGLTFSLPTLTISSAGNGNGALALSGTTSGTATCTAPAVAGTSTNPVTCTNALSLGTNPATSGFFNLPNNGKIQYRNPANSNDIQTLFVDASSALILGSGGGAGVAPASVQLYAGAASGGLVSLTVGLNAHEVTTDSGSAFCVSTDTCWWRDAAGVLSFGSSTVNDKSGKLKASGYISAGTKFTTDTGCGTIVTSSGGGTAGKFTTVGSTSCTVVVTLGDTATAPNGWACYAHDLTTSADYNNPHVSSSTTTATIVTGTIVSGDVIEFACVGY